MYLIMVDACTKWPEVFEMDPPLPRSTTTTGIGQFVSEECRQCIDANGVNTSAMLHTAQLLTFQLNA